MLNITNGTCGNFPSACTCQSLLFICLSYYMQRCAPECFTSGRKLGIPFRLWHSTHKASLLINLHSSFSLSLSLSHHVRHAQRVCQPHIQRQKTSIAKRIYCQIFSSHCTAMIPRQVGREINLFYFENVVSGSDLSLALM